MRSAGPPDAEPPLERARRRSLLLVAGAVVARLGPGLREAGYSVRTVGDLVAAQAELATQPSDLVLCELAPPVDASAVAALCHHGATVLTLVPARALQTGDLAAALIAAGAYDCLGLPCGLAEVLLALGKAAAREARLGDRAALRFLPAPQLAAATPLGPVWPEFIATAPRMRELLAQIAKVAPHATGVLIIGESGTGKELLARAVHALSPRREGPFLAVNCGALPETLLESLLFGHLRGAFTDAIRDQPGLFQQASGGTLFLDEVGELPHSLQVKLLRVLQERMVLPLGAQAPVKVDVRLISATLRDLEAEVAAGRFRADLYYRLNVVPLVVPPLRERTADILPLARYFLHRCAERLHLPVVGLTPAAEAALGHYRWPGNVRELENTIERAAVLGDSTLIDLPDLPPELAYAVGSPRRSRRIAAPDRTPSVLDPARAADPASPDAPPSDGPTDPAAPAEFRLQPGELSIKQATRRLELALIRRALIKTRGNRTAAAKLLELSHRALLYKLREYDLE